jgi:hypothetical protein
MNPFYKVGSSTSFYHVAVNPKRGVTIWKYVGQTVDDNGGQIGYYELEDSMATIQIPTVQELEQAQFVNIAGVKRKFLFDEVSVRALNRNLDRGQDYIEWNDLYYSVYMIDQENLGDDVIVWGIEQKDAPGINNRYQVLNPVVSREILK